MNEISIYNVKIFLYRYQVFRPNKQSLINNVNFSRGIPVSYPKRGAFSVINSFQSKALRKLLKDGSSFFKISLIISSKLYENCCFRFNLKLLPLEDSPDFQKNQRFE